MVGQLRRRAVLLPIRDDIQLPRLYRSELELHRKLHELLALGIAKTHTIGAHNTLLPRM